MVDVSLLFEAIGTVFSWPTISFLFIGILIGIIGGSLPGVGGALTIAIMLPFTLQMGATNAIILLISAYNGVMYGGSISAILFNVPGSASAAATTLEGYPMAKQGRAISALTISAVASGIGDFLGAVAILLLLPVMVTIVVTFGTAEYFLVAVLGLALIVVVSKGSFLKDVMAGGFGVMVAMIGVAPMATTPRYTLGLFSLYQGVNFVAALIGIFAVSEMLRLSGLEGSISREGGAAIGGSVWSGVREVLSEPLTIIKSSIIGLAIGAVPGSGGSVSTFIAYGEAQRSSDNPDKFGDGAEDGIVATESANNATVSGSLIPTLTFGIPGSTTTAVLIGGLLLHGIRPGPALFSEQIGMTYSVFVSILVCSIIIILFGLFVVRWTGYITTINTDLLVPIIITLSVLGAFSLRANYIDVFVVLVLGIIGFFMDIYGYSIVAFLLGLILGPIAEENLYQALQISGGDFGIFAAGPLRLALIVATIAVLFGPYLKPAYQWTKNKIST